MISDANRDVRDVLRTRLLLVTRILRRQRSVGALLEKYNLATPAELPDLPRLQAELHAAQRALRLTQVRRLEGELRERVLGTPPAQRLVWVPGSGTMVAYTLRLEIDDIGRFPTHDVQDLTSTWERAPPRPPSGARCALDRNLVRTVSQRCARCRRAVGSAPSAAIAPSG